MNFASSLIERALGSPAKLRILTTLRTWSGGELTERQLASLCGLSTFGLKHALEDLEALHLVTKKVVGRSYIWALNQQSFTLGTLMPVLDRLINIPDPLEKVSETLRRELPLKDIERIVFFGSAVEKDFFEAGDIDVAVFLKKSPKEMEIKSRTTGKIEELTGALLPEIGKRLEGHIFTWQEWQNLKKKPLMHSIERGQKVYPHETD